MEKAISTHLFLFEILDEPLADMIAEHGFFTLEIWGMRPHVEYDDPRAVECLSGLLIERDIRVASVHAPVYRSIEDALAGHWLSLTNEDHDGRDQALLETEKVIRFARRLGAERVILHPGEAGDPWDAVTRERFQGSLDRLMRTAEKEEIWLALENITSELSVTEHLMVMLDQYDPERVGVCLDLGHLNLNEEPVRAIKCCGPRLGTIHVHDNDGQWDAHFVPGRGNMDWVAIVSALREEGYGGPFIYEIGEPDKERSKGLKRYEPVLVEIGESYRRLIEMGRG